MLLNKFDKFREQLADEHVFNNFKEIVKKPRGNVKQQDEYKKLLEELDSKIDNYKQENYDQKKYEKQKPIRKKKDPAKPKADTKKGAKSKPQKKKGKQWEESDQEELGEMEIEEIDEDDLVSEGDQPDQATTGHRNKSQPPKPASKL